MRVLAISMLAVAPALALSCRGQSSSDSNGGNSTGGSGGTSNPGNEDCNDERQAMREVIQANKACSDTSECMMHQVGCGVTEDDCTGAVYTNDEVDQGHFDSLRTELWDCVMTHESSAGCAVCERVPRPPTCREGLCVGASGCQLQIAALWDFKSRNDACETSDDCVTEQVGCDVTEDDCTGAVYYAASFDRAEFERLRDEYYACAGMCGACLRVTSPPGCVSGHCQILPTR